MERWASASWVQRGVGPMTATQPDGVGTPHPGAYEAYGRTDGHAPPALATRYAVSQGPLNTRNCRVQCPFVQLIGERTVPGDAHQGRDVAAQIVHGPCDRVRHLGLVHPQLVVFALRVIVEMWRFVEAVEAQELHRLVVDVAIDPQRWPAIVSGFAIAHVEAKPTDPDRHPLLRLCSCSCHWRVPPRAWRPSYPSCRSDRLSDISLSVS